MPNIQQGTMNVAKACFITCSRAYFRACFQRLAPSSFSYFEVSPNPSFWFIHALCNIYLVLVYICTLKSLFLSGKRRKKYIRKGDHFSCTFIRNSAVGCGCMEPPNSGLFGGCGFCLTGLWLWLYLTMQVIVHLGGLCAYAVHKSWWVCHLPSVSRWELCHTNCR